MIPSGVEIFVRLTPIDLRWGFDRLAGMVEEQIRRSARSGALFVFFGKRKSALKILFFDGSGLCQFYSMASTLIFRSRKAAECACTEKISRDVRKLLNDEIAYARGRIVAEQAQCPDLATMLASLPELAALLDAERAWSSQRIGHHAAQNDADDRRRLHGSVKRIPYESHGARPPFSCCRTERKNANADSLLFFQQLGIKQLQ